ncbi:ribosome 60S biogenesis N-terminal-domain-containing protein [Cladochytrium replicatum]|nr:ribosome 60S biogenesis N-terminal-domain-containing protein [Cladochytrium replicatum]
MVSSNPKKRKAEVALEKNDEESAVVTGGSKSSSKKKVMTLSTLENDGEESNRSGSVGEVKAVSSNQPAQTLETLRSVLASSNDEEVFQGLNAFSQQLIQLIGRTAISNSLDSEVVKGYLAGSPDANDLFKIWSYQQQYKVARLESVIVDAIARLILAARNIDLRTSSIAIAKNVVKMHMTAVHRNLSSGRPVLVQSTLRLLVAIASSSLAVAKELQQSFTFSMKVLPTFLTIRKKVGKEGAGKPRPPVEDIRLLYIRFMCAFLTHKNAALTKAILETKEFLGSIFKGMIEDPFETIETTLNSLRRNVIDDQTLARSVKVSFFTNFVLEHIARLYSRSNPAVDVSVFALKSETGVKTVAEVAHRFLIHLCTIPGLGLCFKDKAWYPPSNSGGAKNVKLYNKVLLRFLGVLKPSEDAKQLELVLRILRNVPELVQPYWSASNMSFEPRASPKWLANMATAVKIISLPVPGPYFGAPSMTIDLGGSDPISGSSSSSTIAVPLSEPPPSVSVLADNILPSSTSASVSSSFGATASGGSGVLSRAVLTRALQHTSDVVRYTTLVTLAFSCEKFARVIRVLRRASANCRVAVALSSHAQSQVDLAAKWERCADNLTEEMRRRLPDIQVLLALVQKKQTEKPDKEDSKKLNVDNAKNTESVENDLGTESVDTKSMYAAALRLVIAYQRHFPETVMESRFDVGKLIPAEINFKAGETGEETADLQLQMLRLLAESPDLKWWNKSGSSSLSRLGSLIEMYLSTRSNGDEANDSFRPHLLAFHSLSYKAIHRLLASSLLFQQGRFAEEIGIWLEALTSISDSEVLANVVAWFDEALCSGMRQSYRLIDRVTQLSGARENESFSEVEREWAHCTKHVEECRWLGDVSNEDIETGSSVSPALVCVMDGFVALVGRWRKAVEGSDDQAAARLQKEVKHAAFVLGHGVLGVLHRTQGSGIFLTELVRRSLREIGPSDAMDVDDESSDKVQSGDFDPTSFLRAVLNHLQRYTGKHISKLDPLGIGLLFTSTKSFEAQILTTLCAPENSIDSAAGLLSSIAAEPDPRRLVQMATGGLLELQALRRMGEGFPIQLCTKMLFAIFERVRFGAGKGLVSADAEAMDSDLNDDPVDGMADHSNGDKEEDNDQQEVDEPGEPVDVIDLPNTGKAEEPAEPEILAQDDGMPDESGETGIEEDQIRNTWARCYKVVSQLIFGHPVVQEEFFGEAATVMKEPITILVHESASLDLSSVKASNISSDAWLGYKARLLEYVIEVHPSGDDPYIPRETLLSLKIFSPLFDTNDNKALMQLVFSPASNELGTIGQSIFQILMGNGYLGEVKRVSSQEFKRVLGWMQEAGSENTIVDKWLLSALPDSNKANPILEIEGSQDVVDVFDNCLEFMCDNPSLLRAEMLRRLVRQSATHRETIVKWIKKQSKKGSSFHPRWTDRMLGTLLEGLIASKDVPEAILSKLHFSIAPQFISRMIERLSGIKQYPENEEEGAVLDEIKVFISFIERFKSAYSDTSKVTTDVTETLRAENAGVAVEMLARYVPVLKSMERASQTALARAESLFIRLAILRTFFVFAGRKPTNSGTQSEENAARDIMKSMEDDMYADNSPEVPRILLKIGSGEGAGAKEKFKVKPFVITTMRYRFEDPFVISFLDSIFRWMYDKKKNIPEHELPITADFLTDLILTHSRYDHVVGYVKSTGLRKDQASFSPGKSAVTRLLYTLISHDPVRCCKLEHLPLLVRGYAGTRRESYVLSCLFVYESESGISVSRAVQEAVKDWWDDGAGVDPRIMGDSIRLYPIKEGMSTIRHDPGDQEGRLYDPCFIYMMTADGLMKAVSQESTATDLILDIRKWIDSGIVGLCVMGLASEDEDTRRIASFLMEKIYLFIKRNQVRSLKERNQLLVLLEAFRNAIEPSAKPNETPHPLSQTARVPTVLTYFVASALTVLLRPDSFMYPLISGFLLKRPILDLTDVPMLYALLYSASDNARKERMWLLRLLASGLRSSPDYALYKRRHILDTIMGMFESPLADQGTRLQILQVIGQAAAIPDCLRELVQDGNLLSFLHIMSIHISFAPTSSKATVSGVQGTKRAGDQIECLGLLFLRLVTKVYQSWKRWGHEQQKMRRGGAIVVQDAFNAIGFILISRFEEGIGAKSRPVAKLETYWSNIGHLICNFLENLTDEDNRRHGPFELFISRHQGLSR